ncbi:MAG: PTPA-CTERM sorting domain-containing protein [Limnothrix sp. RL_2_0]|nr:PTPA-CTERM sorting domain-containing protein [Limnothrix sp. RL_2_0]
MKNLVAKAGVAAVTSVLFSSVVSVPEAKAFDLRASDVTTQTFTQGDFTCSDNPTGGGDQIRTPGLDEPFSSAGAVSVGEFCSNESIALIEYDLTNQGVSFPNFLGLDDLLDPMVEYLIKFKVFTEDGAGGLGLTGDQQNSGPGHEYTGLVDVLLYTDASIANSQINPLAINPNPFTQIDLSQYSAGDEITIDVTDVVKSLFQNAFTATIPINPLEQILLGMSLRVNPGDNLFMTSTGQRNVGACGFDGVKCLGVTFNDFDVVPTPAAVLPTLFGLASAAFRKKKRNEEV